MNEYNTKLVLINIVSSNPKQLASFYKEVLGADVNEEHGGPTRIEIWFGERNDSNVCIVVNYDEKFVPQKYNTCQGFEFRVADANAEYQRIRSLGIDIKKTPEDLPWGYRYFHIKDPDGNGIDIVSKL